MDISKLKPGDNHYQAYVGPPAQYDFMGATQFRLLCTLGLRAHHYLLDFGCGSLRSGRLFLSYLDEGRYFGIEPNKWLIEDSISNQVGKDLIELKKPRFDYNSDFKTDVFSEQFDFIVAQSIFSHTGRDIIATAMRNMKESLKPDGLIVATFIEGIKDYDGNGWVYPDCVKYSPVTIKRFAKETGLFASRIPWFHPRQTWYLFGRNKSRLPNKVMRRYLAGAVLFEPEFAASWKKSQQIIRFIKKYTTLILPQRVRNSLKKLLLDKTNCQ
ncbi:MAG: class I SAM-dependent methyltransferase [Desulfobacterales bacterium]